MKKSSQQNTPIFLTLGLALAALGIIVGLLLAGSYKYTIQVFDAEQRPTLLAEQAAMLPIRVVTRIAARVGLFAGLGLAAWRVGGSLLTWLDIRARQIHARNGLFPVIQTAHGLYDPNRDNPGSLPVVTLGALAVQKQAALGAIEKVNLSIKDSGASVPMLTQDEAQAVIEWPNKIPLRALLDDAPSINSLILGVTLDESGKREVIRGNMADLVHVAVGGSSGWGKSVFLKALGYQIALAQEKPYLCLVDLEGVTLNAFAQCDTLLYPLADTEAAAIAVFQALNVEMEDRKARFNQYPGVDNLAAYNAAAGEPLKPVVCLVDEATALLDNKDVEGYLKPLTLRARKYGLWLILAGQDWKASSLDTAIRNQLSTRIHFKALNGAQSRVLLGEGIAKDLTAKGRAFAVLPGRSMIEMQVPFVSNQLLAEIGGNGAQQPFPAIMDITATPVIEDDPTMQEDERIRHLYAQGVSLNEIQKRVLGGIGGNYYYRVKEVLGSN